VAKYKPYSYAQGQLIPVMFSKQIQPGTFEFTLNHLIDHELDLAYFDHRFQNDETGAPAFVPRILLKKSSCLPIPGASPQAARLPNAAKQWSGTRRGRKGGKSAFCSCG